MNHTEIEDYYDNFLKNTKINVTEGEGNYFWIKYEGLSAVRFPEFIVNPPSKNEIKRVFKKLKSLLLSYTILPKTTDDANAFLYNCTNNNYNIEDLIKNVRRDIRISQRHLDFEFTDWDDLLSNGFKAFSDTRSRVGLSDGTEKNFKNRFSEFSQNPSHKVVAAKLENEMVAFMSLIVLDDFVIIQGSFSTSEHRKFCPNNGLADFVLNYYLRQKEFKLVCYGLSSIQENTGKEGLHSYKVRIGFEAIPVKRVFIFNPFVSPFKFVIKSSLYILLLIFPHNRPIRKASGIIKLLTS